MNRNELFSGLARGAMHGCGEVFYGMQNDERPVSQDVPQETPVQEPVRQQAQQPEREVDVDIRGWLRRRDHALNY